MAVPRRVERVALAEQVYELLKERILDQIYKPQQKLNIDALVRELAVSSTPIREALSRLTAEGLVSAAVFVGFAVAPLPDRKYFADLYAFRLHVEPWAAASAANLRPPTALAILADALEAMKVETLSRQYRRNRGFLEADDRFHRTILEASDNEVARRCYENLRVHLNTSRLFITREQDARTTYEEHRAISAAIEAGQPIAATDRMRDHLEASRRRLLD